MFARFLAFLVVLRCKLGWHHFHVRTLRYYRSYVIRPKFNRVWTRVVAHRCEGCGKYKFTENHRRVTKDWQYPERLFEEPSKELH